MKKQVLAGVAALGIPGTAAFGQTWGHWPVDEGGSVNSYTLTDSAKQRPDPEADAVALARADELTIDAFGSGTLGSPGEAAWVGPIGASRDENAPGCSGGLATNTCLHSPFVGCWESDFRGRTKGEIKKAFSQGITGKGYALRSGDSKGHLGGEEQ